MGYYTVYLAVISPCSSSQGTSCQEGHLLLSDRKSILMAQNLEGHLLLSDRKSILMAQNLVRSSDWSICSYS